MAPWQVITPFSPFIEKLKKLVNSHKTKDEKNYATFRKKDLTKIMATCEKRSYV